MTLPLAAVTVLLAALETSSTDDMSSFGFFVVTSSVASSPSP